MARGRIISRTLGSSRKFAELGERAGKLGEFAQALFPLIVVVSDDFGRLQGDPESVKWVAWPSSPRSIKDFDQALTVMEQVGLIRRYLVNETAYVAIVCFDDHQLGLHKRTKSRFPEPPGTSGNFPAIPSEEKRREENRTTVAKEPATPSEEALKESEPEVGAFIKAFCLAFKRDMGATYLVRRSKDVPNVRRLLKTYGFDRSLALADTMLDPDNPDEFIRQSDRGIGVLTVKASWLDTRLAEHDRTHKPVN